MHRPRMTKATYLTVGKALRTAFAPPIDETLAPWQAQAIAAEVLADVFAADNPLFDRDRFLHYVETGQDVRVTPASVKGAQKAIAGGAA